MAVTTSNVIVETFPNSVAAQRAVVALQKAGFSNAQIGVAGRHEFPVTTASGTHLESVKPDITPAENTEVVAAEGAGVGAGVGAAIGVGIVVVMVPLVGPLMAGGTLAVLLASAAGGTIGGLGGALVSMGVAESQARHLESEWKSGKSIVTVQTDARADEAAEILFNCGGHDRQNDAK